MEAVCERGNLMLAYQRVVENKGSAGADGIGVAEFKDHLKQHWPAIKAMLLAGDYMPQPVRRVDIPKPQGGVRTLGIRCDGSSVFNEPPDAEPHVRWCGRTAGVILPPTR